VPARQRTDTNDQDGVLETAKREEDGQLVAQKKDFSVSLWRA